MKKIIFSIFFFILLFPFKIHAAALTSLTVVPWSSDISFTGKHTINFTTATSIPANGKIVITYPSGFNVSSATFDTWNGFTGGTSISISGQTITITRDNTGSSSSAGAKYIVLNNITNIITAASTYTSIIETRDNSNATLDGPTNSSNFSVTDINDELDTDAPWPKLKGGYENTARGKNAGPLYPAIKWVYASEYADSHTAIVQDSSGNIYFGGNKTYSVSSSGTLRWKSTAPGGNIYYLALAKNNILYALGDTYVYSYNKNTGEINWTYNISDSSPYNTGISLGIDGTVYVFGRNKQYAFNSDGSLKWTSTSINSRMAPSIGIRSSNGYIYFAGEGGAGVATPDGKVVNKSGLFVDNILSIAADGSGYISGRYAADGVYGFLANGTVKWHISSSLGGGSSIGGLSTDDSTYFTHSGGNLYAFNTSDGSNKWGPITTSGTTWVGDLAIDTFNNLVFDGNYAFNTSDGSTKWKYYAMGNCDFPTIGKDNILYCMQHYSDTRAVYAITPWTTSVSMNKTAFKPGETINFTVVSSMLKNDPTTTENNLVQIILNNTDTVTLSYDSSDNGNSIWKGSYTVGENVINGTYSGTIEAAQFKVQTDQTVHFSNPPTGSNNTGLRTNFNYRIDTNPPDKIWKDSARSEYTFGGALGDNVYTDDQLPTFQFTQAQDNTYGINKYQILIKDREGYQKVYIDNILPANNTDIFEDDTKFVKYDTTKKVISVRSKKSTDKLSEAEYKWHVRAINKIDTALDSKDYILRVKTNRAIFSKTSIAFPLAVLQIGNLNTLNINSYAPNFLIPSLTINTPRPTFYGIANVGAHIKLTLIKHNTTPQGSWNDTYNYTTDTNADSRYGINVSQVLANGNYTVSISATNDQGDYIELPHFNLKVQAK